MEPNGGSETSDHLYIVRKYPRNRSTRALIDTGAVARTGQIEVDGSEIVKGTCEVKVNEPEGRDVSETARARPRPRNRSSKVETLRPLEPPSTHSIPHLGK